MSATDIRTDVDASHTGVHAAHPKALRQAGADDPGDQLLAGFSLDCRVHDRQALYKAAMGHAITEDSLDEQAADELLRPNGVIDVTSCLVMLLDPGSIPGCTVLGSGVSLHELVGCTTAGPM